LKGYLIVGRSKFASMSGRVELAGRPLEWLRVLLKETW